MLNEAVTIALFLAMFCQSATKLIRKKKIKVIIFWKTSNQQISSTQFQIITLTIDLFYVKLYLPNLELIFTLALCRIKSETTSEDPDRDACIKGVQP